MDLENGANLKLDIDKVPEALRDLAPLVEKWAFASQDDQDRFLEQMQKLRPEEVKIFSSLIREHRPVFQEWSRLITQFDKQTSEFSEEDWEHPYWAYLTAFKMEEFTDDPSDSPKTVAVRRRVAEENREIAFKEAIAEADDAFRNGDYVKYIRLLEPFEDLVSEIQKKKIQIARKRSQ